MTHETPRRLRIGIIAPEFYGYGGMAEFSRQLAGGLAHADDVTVYTREGARNQDPPVPDVPIQPLLVRELSADGASLARQEVDVWFAANAGYAPLAATLPAPTAVYVNGNDLLRPWVRRDRSWVDRIETSTLIWRVVGQLRETLRRSDLKRGLRAAARIIANSENTAAIFRHHYPGHEARTDVVTPGVADDYFVSRPERSPGPLRVLTVTRLDRGTPRKNVDGVLRAISLLPDAADVVYTVVGDGEDRPRVERLADELGVREGTRFVGFVRRDELAQIYAESDLFILASRASASDVEGFGIVYLEASAAGTPVLCSRAGGAVEAVQEGRNGLVIADSEPATIARAIENFAAHPRRFDPDEVRAVAEEYRWPAIAARIRQILAECVAAANG